MSTPDTGGYGAPGPYQTDPDQPSADTTAYPTATATLPPQGPPVKKAAGLAIAALVVGIGAFLFGLVPVFGALVGIAAVVLGVLAVRKQQSKGMAVTGIVLGAIAVVSSLAMAFGLGAIMSGASDDAPVAAAVETSAPVEELASPSASETSEPVQEAQAPEPAAPAVPVEYASALIQAESYSSMLNMSKAGIYDQLVSEYGGQFTPEAAQYAIDTIQADWNANALAKAKSYQETMALSPEAIRDQLTSEYGEKFTPEEADYAVQNLAS